jgi:MoaA/NifB/PqqE/SkfB family radical SAM enzyme
MIWPTLTNLFHPRLDWIQVEVTTHCQAACSYCPHTVYREHWKSRHLALDTFQRLLPDLKRARLVHLQGWGEPLLHPDFFTLVSLARGAGCTVGTTTNGMLLDTDSLRRLVDLEVSVVAFSLAGVGGKNDAVRRGTTFAAVLEKIVALNEIKARKGALLPRVNVAYMLLSSGLDDLALLPQALAGLGVGQVVAADGALAPCVFLNLPVSEETYVSLEGEAPYRRLGFGNLTEEQSFLRIWRSPDYRAFRRAWGCGALPPACRGCLKPLKKPGGNEA